MFDLTLSEQAMYLLKMEKFIVYRKHTKVYRQSVLVCRIRLERPMFQYSRDAKLVKEDIVVMDAIGVENVEENEKYSIQSLESRMRMKQGCKGNKYPYNLEFLYLIRLNFLKQSFLQNLREI